MTKKKNEMTTRYVMPTLEAQIIYLKDRIGFKTKIKQGTGTKADGELASEILVTALDRYEIEDIGTHFNDKYYEMIEKKKKERETVPYPFGDDPTLTPQDNDVA